MRSLPPALAAALQSGAATLCRCWRLTRTDGFALGFTDHDGTLTLDGLTFDSTDGFEASVIEQSAGLATQGGEITGLLTSDRIKASEIEAGLYDGAKIEAFLVDWSAPALDCLIDAATLGEIRRIDERFVAETRDASAPYDMERGRLYAAGCAASFGDAACGLNAQGAAFTDAVTITAVLDARRFEASGAGARPGGFFALGQARFTGGANAGFASRIEAHEGGQISLSVPPPAPLAVGQALALTAGCDKRFATCRERFANALNFRGFPHIPAPEAIFTYARPGEGFHKGRPLVP